MAAKQREAQPVKAVWLALGLLITIAVGYGGVNEARHNSHESARAVLANQIRAELRDSIKGIEEKLDKTLAKVEELAAALIEHATTPQIHEKSEQKSNRIESVSRKVNSEVIRPLVDDLRSRLVKVETMLEYLVKAAEKKDRGG